MGINTCFEQRDLTQQCCVMKTRREMGDQRLDVTYHASAVRPSPLPLNIEIETTASADAYALVGSGPDVGLEIATGADDGSRSFVQWIWRGRRTHEIAGHPSSPQNSRWGARFAKFSVTVS